MKPELQGDDYYDRVGFSTLHRVVGGETMAHRHLIPVRVCFSTLYRVVGGETDAAGRAAWGVGVSVLSIESLGVKQALPRQPPVPRDCFSTLYRVVGGETPSAAKRCGCCALFQYSLSSRWG